MYKKAVVLREHDYPLLLWKWSHHRSVVFLQKKMAATDQVTAIAYRPYTVQSAAYTTTLSSADAGRMNVCMAGGTVTVNGYAGIVPGTEFLFFNSKTYPGGSSNTLTFVDNPSPPSLPSDTTTLTHIISYNDLKTVSANGAAVLKYIGTRTNNYTNTHTFLLIGALTV